MLTGNGRVQHKVGFDEGVWSTTKRVFAILAATSILVLGASWLMEARISLGGPLARQELNIMR
jgi:hypothetical protein